MAIRKMEFAKGEELNIRSFSRMETKLVFENINKLSADPQQLIVKCGKSYWDVTVSPEIFAQAEEFDPGELTEIEKREMKQTAPHVHAYDGQNNASDPMSMLYQKTEEEEEPEYVTRKTFYLTDVVLEVIEAYRYANKMEVSETVRELILRGAPEEILAEAEKNAAVARSTRASQKTTRKKKKRIII